MVTGDTSGFRRSKVVSGQNCSGEVGISQVMSAARDAFTHLFPKGAKTREYTGSAEWGSSTWWKGHVKMGQAEPLDVLCWVPEALHHYNSLKMSILIFLLNM